MIVPKVQQGPPHFLSVAVPAGGLKGTRPQHNPLQPLAAIQRLGQRLALHPGKHRLRLESRIGNPARGDKGNTAVVQQHVQNNAQRVNIQLCDGIDIRLVDGVVVDLRRHIVIGADACKLGGHALHGPGDAKVPQLEIAPLSNEDVLRLNVPVDDVLFPADDQRRANVDAQFDDLLIGKALVGDILEQRGEQLHADEDGPAGNLRLRDHMVVLDGNDVGIALDRLHQANLFSQRSHLVFQIAGDRIPVQALRPQAAQLGGVLGNRDDLDRGLCLPDDIPALDPIHLAVGAGAQVLNDPPVRPGPLNQADDFH